MGYILAHESQVQDYSHLWVTSSAKILNKNTNKHVLSKVLQKFVSDKHISFILLEDFGLEELYVAEAIRYFLKLEITKIIFCSEKLQKYWYYKLTNYI